MQAQSPPLSWNHDEAATARIEFARTSHANLQDLVKVADAKAAAIIAVQAIILGLLGSNLIDRVAAGIRFIGLLGMGGVLLISLALTLGSLLTAMLVLIPRLDLRQEVRPPQRASLLMWLDGLQRFQGDSSKCAAAFAATEPDDVLGDLAYEILKVACLLRRKFLWLPWSLGFLALAIVGWAITLVWAVSLPTSALPPV